MYALILIIHYAQFKTWLESNMPSPNIIYAVEANAKFSSITFRSVPRQAHKPYLALAEVTQRQVVFNQEQITGTLIGFWCPAFTKGLNVPGFHLHFLYILSSSRVGTLRDVIPMSKAGSNIQSTITPPQFWS